LEAFVSWGFEDFTLFDPTCYIYPEIWLEYGGTVKSDTVYCCGPTAGKSRPKELEVDGVSIPLIEDDVFKRFDQRLHRPGPHGPLTRATLIGRFFAGRKETYPNGESAWGGFGHFGCCTLLAIQQVKDADFKDRPGLDPYSLPEPLISGFHKMTVTYYFLVPEDVGKFILDSQKSAEDGSRSWAFEDPKRVALDLIESDLHGEPIDPSALRPTAKAVAGSIEYELNLSSMRKKYSITVSRPYWLSFYAHDPNRVAWVVVDATCEKLGSRKTSE
jgi:hypothetical protein